MSRAPRTRLFGTMPTGEVVSAHTLKNEHGLELTVLDLGATVQSLAFRDGGGNLVDVTLGYEDVAGYVSTANPYIGGTVGRFANRIAGATFRLDEEPYVLVANEGKTCLHGGPGGFHTRVWSVVDEGPQHLRLQLVSPHGDQGFPGTITAAVTHTLEGPSVSIDYSATRTAPTVVSLTNHAYFNLGGPQRSSVDDHVLTVMASGYLPVDAASIPVGTVSPVAGTPFDLNRPASLVSLVRSRHDQVLVTGGIDHAFILDGLDLRDVARLEHPQSGRILDLATDQPSLQVYTGNRLDGTLLGKGGTTLRQGDGIALETQRYPDAPNQPSFPSAVLRPGETYSSLTRWTLS